MGKLIIISGPSCAGKTPLLKALKRCHPSVLRKYRKAVLYTSRARRPGEKEGVDYHFRSRKEILGFKKRAGFIVMRVRGDVQALDTTELAGLLGRSNVIFEGNPFIGGKLLDLKDAVTAGIFISPFSKNEMLSMGKRCAAETIKKIMKKKLLRRAARYKVPRNRALLLDIEKRAGSAPREMKEAYKYEFVLPNRDGEDSPNWKERGKPEGEAARTLRALALILRGRRPAAAEKWPKNLF